MAARRPRAPAGRLDGCFRRTATFRPPRALERTAVPGDLPQDGQAEATRVRRRIHRRVVVVTGRASAPL
eukprot:2263818-Lingulodinium_polyedra.AAC.1